MLPLTKELYLHAKKKKQDVLHKTTKCSSTPIRAKNWKSISRTWEEFQIHNKKVIGGSRKLLTSGILNQKQFTVSEGQDR
jgi:hypothetical protein